MPAKAEDMAARLRAAFPDALHSGQLVAYYQQEVELSSGRLVAAESLARWEHPELGTLPPALFAPVAETLGLMGELTGLMLRLSLAQHRTWAAAGWVIPVSVNVGPDCATDPGFPAVIAEILRSERVPGPMLTLEVSEQTGTAAVSSSFFAQLAELGVRVALDDFGTGFASLESLGGWPVDELKLDMSLVRPITGNSSFRAIVGTTVDLAHQLGVNVVAEGVESEAVRSELQALGCDVGQGFLFGRPVPPGDFADWLRKREPLTPRRGLPGHHQAGGPASAAEADQAGAASRPLRWFVAAMGGGTLTAAAAMMAAYGLWQLFRWGGHRHQALIGDLAFFPVNGAGAVPGDVRGQASRRRLLAPLRGHRAAGRSGPADRVTAAAGAVRTDVSGGRDPGGRGQRRRPGALALRDADVRAALLAGLEKGPVRPPRHGPARGLRVAGPHRRHRQQHWHRTAGRVAWPPGSARMGLRSAVRGRHQPEPVRPPGPGQGGPGHGVLALEPAVHAAAGRGPAVADRHEGREGQRRGHGRAGGRRQHRRQGGGGAEEVTDRPGEYQPGNGHDGHEPTCGAGIADHGRPLFACVPSRGGRASLPSYS